MRSLRVLLLLSLIPISSVQAQEEGEAQALFSYGGSCKQLTQLTRQEIAGIAHPMHGEYFGYFCNPEGEACEDYEALLEGAGQLDDNGQGACRLDLNR